MNILQYTHPTYAYNVYNVDEVAVVMEHNCVGALHHRVTVSYQGPQGKENYLR